MSGTHGDTQDRRIALSRIAGGYKAAAALITAIDLGVFAALAEQPRDADTLAHDLELSPRGTRGLLDALTALDLLRLDGDNRYHLHGLADEFLRPGAELYQGDILLHNASLLKKWARLDEAVREGRPVALPDRQQPASATRDQRAYILGMQNTARASAVSVAEFLDLRPVKRILDLGGGPGTYLYTLLRLAPHAAGAVLDREDVIAIAREVLAREDGLQGRVKFLPGDLFDTDFGDDWDLVLLSNIIHIYGEDDNRTLVAKAAHALAPGGRLLIKDFFLDPHRHAPVDGALFTLNMLVNTEDGRSFSWQEVESWLREAGLTVLRRGRLGAASGLLLAEKPADTSSAP